MHYAEKVAQVVEEVRALGDLARTIVDAVDAFAAEKEKVIGQAKAASYPMKELRGILPKVTAKIEIPPLPPPTTAG